MYILSQKIISSLIVINYYKQTQLILTKYINKHLKDSQKESDNITKWRNEQQERIANKDKEEEVKKVEWKATAKKELDDWYKQRDEQLTKTHANHKLIFIFSLCFAS